MTHEARAIINAGAESAGTPYGAQRAQVMSQAGFDTALAEISSWPGYAPTPLLALSGLTRQLGIGSCFTRTNAAVSAWAVLRP